MNMKTQCSSIWDPVKAVLREKFIVIWARLESKKNLKQPYITPKGAIRKRTNKPQTSSRK